jgi:hypothetical protein
MATSLISSPVKAVILAEAHGQRSRENIVVTQAGAALEEGTLLTRAGDTAPTGAATPDAGNTGNPTFGTINIGARAVPGQYRVRMTAPTKFDVEDPSGKTVGSGTLGAAFNKGGVSFTLTAGGTAAVDGDAFTITVAPGTGKYVPYTAGGAAGPADGILLTRLHAKTGDSKAVGVVRDCEVNRFELVGLDGPGEADLLQRGVLVRGVPTPGIATPAFA